MIIFERTANSNSVSTMYTHHVPNSLKVAYRVPEPVPRTEANYEPCDYGSTFSRKIIAASESL